MCSIISQNSWLNAYLRVSLVVVIWKFEKGSWSYEKMDVFFS